MRPSILDRWKAYWFRPVAATNLGLFRLIIGVLFSYHLLDGGNRIKDLPTLGRAFWLPVALFEWLGLGPLSSESLSNLWLLGRVALVLTTIGLFTRLSAAIGFVTLLYIYGLTNCFGKIVHQPAFVVLWLAVMAIARSGDSWSVDAWIRRRRGFPAPEPSGEYSWPLRTMAAGIAVALFSAGVSKLVASGVSWMTTNGLAEFVLTNRYFHPYHPQATQLDVWLADQKVLTRLLEWFVMAAEIGAPLSFLHRRVAMLMVPAGVMMLISFQFLLGPWFFPLAYLHLAWLPLDRISEWITSRSAALLHRPVPAVADRAARS